MVDFSNHIEQPEYAVKGHQVQISAVFKQVYGWMFAGLGVSGVVAWYVAASGLYQRILAGPGMLACIVAEVVLVMVLSGAIRKLSPLAACAMFLAYSALNGVTLSVVFIAYELALVQRVFFITAGMFGGLALWAPPACFRMHRAGAVHCASGLRHLPFRRGAFPGSRSSRRRRHGSL